ncbi:phosphatidylinositol 3-kinase catalytic subunit, putative [Trypanosoma brucei brucei TREU927]|uniref:Phosphatidylinositol 3-kinase catalytic subunit, putative n=1 Tax=Trypanosoma brucei brucei (strain 927/4 GUTat10.1) TaxID=185431 RepID=Q381Q2_TRYB2|nr:phosphatidylinositol 3-kinase catalytic subunit, putative [Trypanosoma brucei brucei TREU927]EAN80479.1 phosphatidylinositol 3-kinase catalytic subunit, putative [Trypanosoma brucei brucei TREU927]
MCIYPLSIIRVPSLAILSVFNYFSPVCFFFSPVYYNFVAVCGGSRDLMTQSAEVSVTSYEQPLPGRPTDGVGADLPRDADGVRDSTQEFDMLAVDVILGDGTHCALDFAESAYLKRLISQKQPVQLEFGSQVAIEELKRIVALDLRGSKLSRARRQTRADVKSRMSEADDEVLSSFSTSAAPHREDSQACVFFSETTLSRNGTVSCYNACELTRNRELFMEVLELSARLEMEKTFAVLCGEFGRIYKEEVFCDTDIRSLASLNSKEKLCEVLAFREKVMTAFRIGGGSAEPGSPQPRSLQPSKDVLIATGADKSNHQLPCVAWLKKDRYFYPEFYHVGDLTQSIDPSSTTMTEASYLGEDFAKKGHTLYQNPVWEGEDSAKTCSECKRSFSSWPALLFAAVRARNCRCCGRRMCEQCTSWMLDKSLAKLSKPGQPEEGRMRHACKRCYDQAMMINKHTFLCTTFVCAGLSIVDIALLRTVNEQWRAAAELCLSDYRSSLYENMWNMKIPKRTAQILASSVNLLVGHPEPLIFLFISIDWENNELVEKACAAIEQTAKGAAPPPMSPQLRDFYWKPPLSHWYMLCTRTCGRMLPPFFGIKILECLHRAPQGHATAEKIRKIVTKHLLRDWITSLDTCIRECVVLLLLDIFDLESCQPRVVSVLLSLSKLDPQLAIVICQEASARMRVNEFSYRTLQERVIERNADTFPESHQKFLNTLKFLNLITPEVNLVPVGGDAREYQRALVTQLSNSGLMGGLAETTGESVSGCLSTSSRIAQERNGLCAVSPMLFPFDSSVVITHIDLGGIKIMESSQRPVSIPLVDAEGVTRGILVKRENLEKDKVMCVTSRFLRWVLYKQIGNVVLPTYRVILLSPSSGLIEVVKDGQTIHRVIGKDKEGRLLQHLVSLEKTQGQLGDSVSEPQLHERVRGAGHQCGQPNSLIVKDFDSQKSAALARECFMCSAKFFILLNYIFAIGDRHRENVMIHPSGAIFHIDYGMLLTTRTLAEHVLPSYVRFDSDLEGCIEYFMKEEPAPEVQTEGEQDDSCTRFIIQTADWFLEVRSYAGIMHQLLSHIVRRNALDGIKHIGELTALMNLTLMRSLAEESCKETFCKRVKDSRGRTWLKDITHDTHKWTQQAMERGFKWLYKLMSLHPIGVDARNQTK